MKIVQLVDSTYLKTVGYSSLFTRYTSSKVMVIPNLAKMATAVLNHGIPVEIHSRQKGNDKRIHLTLGPRRQDPIP